ncbi:hypothetical protein FACS189419_03200 [Planctomycetales bacterium]|nr:hypothetical protein FACS189419_03200 [Planctomycetales bacterium]
MQKLLLGLLTVFVISLAVTPVQAASVKTVQRAILGLEKAGTFLWKNKGTIPLWLRHRFDFHYCLAAKFQAIVCLLQILLQFARIILRILDCSVRKVRSTTIRNEN